MAECVEIVGPLRRRGEPASHELCSHNGERLVHLCPDNAAGWRRAGGTK